MTADVSSPVQLHEIPAGIGHVVHLQVCCSSEHPGHDAWCQREVGGVHEVQQQGDAGWVQGVRERHGPELLPAAAAPLKQHSVGVQRVEEPTARREGNIEVFKDIWISCSVLNKGDKSEMVEERSEEENHGCLKWKAGKRYRNIQRIVKKIFISNKHTSEKT